MSKTKAGGSKASQHVNPSGKRLGAKVSDGQFVDAGEVLVRQRGTKIKAGSGVGVGRDHTLLATEAGRIKFGTKLGRKTVSVILPK